MEDSGTAEQKEKLCKSCGAKLKENAASCPECGLSTLDWAAVREGLTKVKGGILVQQKSEI